jgi:iron complex transport system permease protein
MSPRCLLLATLLLILGALLVVASLTLGASGVTLADLRRGDEAALTIVWQLRLPRILLAMLAGAALSISGALMQTLFRNPLAEPYITGVSAGGALGAMAATALGLASALGKGLGAFAGGALITAALYAFALRGQRRAPVSILLLGLALGTFCGALVWLLLLRLDPGGGQAQLGWLLGSVRAQGYGELLVFAPAVLAGAALAFWQAPRLDLLLLGEEKAASLGLDILAAQRWILGSATLLAAVCVAFCGVIAFVGLIVPHIMRAAVGATHRQLLPLSALAGAVLLLGVDLLARTIDAPREIPLTIITSLLGAPFFIAVLIRARELRW